MFLHRYPFALPLIAVAMVAASTLVAFIKQLADGSFETSRIGVGRDGLTPPM